MPVLRLRKSSKNAYSTVNPRKMKGEVPVHVSYLLSHLEKLPVYDLYIVPGEWSQVQELRKIFSKGKVPTLSKYDAYVIADTLLSWFSNMEDPLLTFELYEAWMSAA